MEYTGTIFSYSYLCLRKMWLSYHNISLENDNASVAIGKELDESSYSRYQHNIHIDNICVDYLQGNVIMEIKKSDKANEMSIMQVKYYIYRLKCKGLKNLSGCICYPLLKKREEVFLTVDDEKIIEAKLSDIEKILCEKTPPKTIDTKVCKNCAYFQLCYI